MSNKPDDRDVALGCLLMILLIPSVIAFNGYTLHVLWGWFLTPAFGVDPPDVVLCIGLALLVGMFVNVDIAKSKDEGFWEGLAISVLKPIFVNLFALAFGWVLTLFL